MQEDIHSLLIQRTRAFKAAAALASAQHDNAYKGLAAHAKPGLHAYVTERIVRTVSKGSIILDLGAGTGALALRLRDRGYVMHAADYVAENFRVRQLIPFTQFDLNREITGQFNRRFDAVVAVEIIEHLENPRHFLRQCKALVRPGGTIVLTTPNPDSAASKALFVRNGYFGWFSDADCREQGHITPLTLNQLQQCIADARLRLQELSTFGSSEMHLGQSLRLKLLAWMIGKIDLTPLELRNDITVAVLTVPNV